MCIEKTKLKTNEKPRRVCRPQAANNSNHFSPRHVRGEKFLSGCKCGIFVLCAKIMRAAACNPFGRKNEVFSPVKKIAFVSPKRQRRKINLCGTTLVAAPRRPLRPTIRGRGLITALRRPCLLRAFSRSAGSSGVIFAADPVSASHQTGGSLGTDSLGLLIPILAFALYCLSFYHKSRFCQQEITQF